MNEEIQELTDVAIKGVDNVGATAGDSLDIQALNLKIEKASRVTDIIRLEMSKTIIGQTEMVDKLLIGLLANGHVLLEGVPGLAKTLAINSLSKTIDAQFSRIQFT